MENEKSGKDKKPDSRSQRLADELRENLRRRKAQERSRKAPAGARNDPDFRPGESKSCEIGGFLGPDFRRNSPAKVLACLGKACTRVVAVPTSDLQAL